MESDKWIICVEPSQVTMIDLQNGAQVTRRPIQAEAAIMNPGQNVLALRSGTTLQMFNLDAKQKIKSHSMTEAVVFWKWTSATNLALVTAAAVFHWSLADGQAPPVKVFDRNPALATAQIINYRVSPDEKWCLLGGISSGATANVVNGNMQLYSIEKKVSQPLQGHAAAFATLKLTGREDAQVMMFHQKEADSQEPPKLYIREVGRDPAKGAPFGIQPTVIPIPPDAGADFPVSLAVDQKDEIAFMLTKLGFVYLFDMHSGKTIYRAKITQDTVFVTCPQHSTGAIFGITVRKGQVFRLQLNGPALVPYILTRCVIPIWP
jgi:clathrin heavy chain